MDDPVDTFDENGNRDLRFVFGPWTPEQLATIDDYRNKHHIPPISPSFYEAISPSTDYVKNATDMIRNLLNARKAELNDGDHEMVFVWDIGEITTITSQHIAQLYTSHRETNAGRLIMFPTRILQNENFDLVYDVYNVVNIEDVDKAETGEMKERASSYYSLEKLYNDITAGMIDDGPLINYELFERCGLTGEVREIYYSTIQLQRIFHQRWKTARKCLEMINKQSDESHRKYESVVLTDDGIGFGSIELLVADCSKQIAFENVYSFRKDTKEMVFQRIQERFGDKCVLVYITSEPDKASIPKNLQIPIWEVKANDSIEHLYNALQQNLFQ